MFAGVLFLSGADTKGSGADSSETRKGRFVQLEWTHPNTKNVVGFKISKLSGKKRKALGFVPGSYIQPHSPKTKFRFYDQHADNADQYRVEVVSTNAADSLVPFRVSVVDSNAQTTFRKTEQVRLGNATRRGLADTENQRLVASQDGIKIRTKGRGLFRVSRSELESTGFDLSGNPKNWQLYFKGVEQATTIGENGSFIEFFGRETDTPESDLSTYFLIQGNTAGKQIGNTFIRRIAPEVRSRNFRQKLTRTNRMIYVTTILNGSDSNYFGEVINTPGSTVSIDLPGIDTDSSRSVKVKISTQGLTFGVHTVLPNINGKDYEAIRGADRNNVAREYEIPASLFSESGNAFNFRSVNGGSDISLLDTVEIEYDRLFEAEQGRIEFESANYKKTEIKGFNDDSVRVFDLTNPDNPRTVVNAETVEINPGEYAVNLPPARSRKFFAFEESTVQSAFSIVRNRPSTHASSSNAADLVIIAHDEWFGEALDYGIARNAAGLNTTVVDVEDLYDEFSFGEKTALAIRGFLEHAHATWMSPPKYALLLGDGTYDALNIGGEGEHNKMPILLVDTLYEETASDEALADFNGDGLAEIAIGRIPVRSGTDVVNAMNKVNSFESSVSSAASRGFLCASDLPDGFDFEGLCDELEEKFPKSTPGTKINRGDANARQDLLAEINSGKYFINYSGHGTTSVWATTGFFGQPDVSTLTNKELPVYTMLTCLNGYFIRPVQDSLSEELVRSPNRGAVAVWSSSGTTTPDFQSVMANRFYDQLANNPSLYRIGDVVNDAKAALSGGTDVRRSWVFLGDPSLKIKDAQTDLSK